MLVKVQFKSRFKPYNYGGNEYTYDCDLDVSVGDVVTVPVGIGENGTGVARVSEINVDETSVPPDVLCRLKKVTGWANYEQTLIPDEQQEMPTLPEVQFAENIIVIKQLPIIEDQLRTLRESVENKVHEALSLAVTEDTVKAVKTVRAALNKEYKDLEERRKQVKLAILEPYDRFEATYRECIGNLYTDADRQLKEKIDAVEDGVKEQKRSALKAYYEEYRASVYLSGEPMADFDRWCTKVNKSASDKSLRDAAKVYLDGLRGDLDSIATMENADEILVEYKACRELSKAISTVNDRIRKKEEERKRMADAAAERAAREAREREAREKVEAAAKVKPVEPPVEVQKPAAPEEQPAAEKVFPRFTFTVINATRSQLIKVREFMKQEGIQYE